MIETRLLDFDPETGKTSWFHYDHSDDSYTIETTEEQQPLLDVNKAQFNDAPETGRYKGSRRKIASLPMILYFQLQRDGILDDPKRFRAWLNDRDNQYFRTTPGRV